MLLGLIATARVSAATAWSLLTLLRFGAGDALLDEAIVRIDLGGAQKSGKISFGGAQREMELVEAAPEEQQRRERNSERGSRQYAHSESARVARRPRRCSRGRT